MILSNIKKLLFDLGKFIVVEESNQKIDTRINSSYGYIENNVKNELENKSKKVFRSKVEKLNYEMNYDINKKYNMAINEINQMIINKRIEGKNYKNRLNNNKVIFKRKVKNVKFDDKNRKIKITTLVKREYNKVKKVLRTETHRVVEGVKNYAYEAVKPSLHKKQWHAVFRNTRDTHKQMHLQIEDQDGYFYSPAGGQTKYPGGFGIAKEDINCQCYLRFKRVG